MHWVWVNNFYWCTLVFLTIVPERASFKSSLTKIVRKDRATRDLTSSQVNFSCRPRPHAMQPAVGNQQPHGHPGTPVGDLFPLGNALLGDGSRSSLRPIRAGELRSHSAEVEGGAKAAVEKWPCCLRWRDSWCCESNRQLHVGVSSMIAVKTSYLSILV